MVQKFFIVRMSEIGLKVSCNGFLCKVVLTRIKQLLLYAMWQFMSFSFNPFSQTFSYETFDKLIFILNKVFLIHDFLFMSKVQTSATLFTDLFSSFSCKRCKSCCVRQLIDFKKDMKRNKNRNLVPKINHWREEKNH